MIASVAGVCSRPTKGLNCHDEMSMRGSRRLPHGGPMKWTSLPGNRNDQSCEYLVRATRQTNKTATTIAIRTL